MASLNVRNGLLFIDFRFNGQRCREYTKLADTSSNRKRVAQLVNVIEQEISLGTFKYTAHFPGSKMAGKLSVSIEQQPNQIAITSKATTTAGFSTFAEDWYRVTKISWRTSHAATVRSTLDRHLLPHFGERDFSTITKSDVLEFRAELSMLKGRGKNVGLSPKTINRVIQVLSQIFDEAAERYSIVNPIDKIKRLRQQRVDILPFSLDQVRLLIDSIRPDYRDYLIVRFFTGMRTGEIHGLMHKYLDFDRRQILIRESIVRGERTYTKTDGSQREISMSQPVFEALKRQVAATEGKSEFVFCTRSGKPLDVDDVTNRVWYPLLRYLGIEPRRPYQTRHTAATLWLGAGENPEWVARQLGHSSTEMLFKTYSRYVPNLTRRDGSAINNLLTNAMNGGTASGEENHV